MSYSTWINIEKFVCITPSTANSSSTNFNQNQHIHPIRILTLLRHSRIKDTLTSCLAVYLSPKNRSLFVSTEECLLQNQKTNTNSGHMNNGAIPKLGDQTAMFNCHELFQESQWLHIVLVWNRAVLKNSSVSLYINSKLIDTQKLQYMNVIGSSSSSQGQQASTSVHAVIGTLPMFRLQSPVIWRQASCYLFEDILTNQFIQNLYQLGPNYLGSFQAPNSDSGDSLASMQLAEERLVFGLHAQKIFEMTLAKFRRIYNKNDSKIIGKQLNIPSHESVTPLRILSNTAQQLNGPARSVGGVVIGYLGVSTINPHPLFKTLEDVGGIYVIVSRFHFF